MSGQHEHVLRFHDAGTLPCPVEGCGCDHLHLSQKVKTDRYGEEHVTLGLFCEWGHLITLNLTEYHGATIYSMSVEEDPESLVDDAAGTEAR